MICAGCEHPRSNHCDGIGRCNSTAQCDCTIGQDCQVCDCPAFSTEGHSTQD